MDNRTKITFDYENKHYVLVYTADALKKMEKLHGVKFGKLEEQVFTSGEELFFGAFIANHDNVPRRKRLEIYKSLCSSVEDGEESVGEVLIEMLKEAMEEIGPRGNVSWKVERKA